MHILKMFVMTILVLILLFCIMVLVPYIVPNIASFQTYEEVTTAEKQQAIKEAEKLISESSDVVVWNGEAYPKDEFIAEIEQAKRDITLSSISRVASFAGTVVVMLLCLYCLFLLAAWDYRCPACKKLLVMQEKATRHTHSEEFEYKVKLNRRSYDGSIIGTDEGIAHGTREHYKTLYQCKFCGYEKELHKTKEIRPI